MRGIGGNVIANIQTAVSGKNIIGEMVQVWEDKQQILGWLDFASGDAEYSKYSAKIQETTHYFIADYVELAKGIEAETSRMIIDGKVYDIVMIDNPMGLKYGSQLEFYLKYSGGQ